MSHRRHRFRSGPQRAFTLIELLIVIAVMGVLIVAATPSVKDMLQMQRLRGANAQFVTDMQFARAEAAARSRHVRVSMGSNAGTTCYVVYLAPSSNQRCDCLRGAGAACIIPPAAVAAAGFEELRTVTVERSSGVALTWPAGQSPHFGFDPSTSGLVSVPSDTAPVPVASVQVEARIDDDRRLRNTLARTGRPAVCAPNAQRMGVTGC